MHIKRLHKTHQMTHASLFAHVLWLTTIFSVHAPVFDSITQMIAVSVVATLMTQFAFRDVSDPTLHLIWMNAFSLSHLARTQPTHKKGYRVDGIVCE